MKQYQDIWVKGQAEIRGTRECAARYELVRQFCAQYKRPFTVLDIGANDGYFAIRLTEDFPECTVVAVEKRAALGDTLKRNDARRVLWLHKEVTVADIRALAAVEHFDVTLALSVIHYFDEPPAASLAALSVLGDNLILELPMEWGRTPSVLGAAALTECVQSAREGNQTWEDIRSVVQAFVAPYHPTLLGYGESPKRALPPRYILAIHQPKTGLMRSYWVENKLMPVPTVSIASDFTAKAVRKVAWKVADESTSYPWHRGINLRTFLGLNGAWPEREVIARQVRRAFGRLGRLHGGASASNVILAGDRATAIDLLKVPPPTSTREARRIALLVARILQPPVE